MMFTAQNALTSCKHITWLYGMRASRSPVNLDKNVLYPAELVCEVGWPAPMLYVVMLIWLPRGLAGATYVCVAGPSWAISRPVLDAAAAIAPARDVPAAAARLSLDGADGCRTMIDVQFHRLRRRLCPAVARGHPSSIPILWKSTTRFHTKHESHILLD